MVAKRSVLGLIMSYPTYLRSAMVRFPLHPDEDDIFSMAPTKYELNQRSVGKLLNGLTDLVGRKSLGDLQNPGELNLGERKDHKQTFVCLLRVEMQ